MKASGGLSEAIFEFGRGFYGNTYTPVLSGLTLTPGPLQIFCKESWAGLGTRLTYVQQTSGGIIREKSCVAHDCKLL